MYSLNVPLPSEVARRAGEIARQLPQATPRERGEHTLLAKRLGSGQAAEYNRYEAAAREVLAGTAPFALRIDRIDCFAEAAAGPSPVVYLGVDSPGLVAVHDRLCDRFDPQPDLGGDDYVPHVTIARGGSIEAARTVCGPIDPIEWTAEALEFYDAERGLAASRLSLPA